MNPNQTIETGDYVTVAPVARGASFALPHGSRSGADEETAQSMIETHGTSGWQVVTNDTGCECCAPSPGEITDTDGDVNLEKNGWSLFVYPEFLTLDGEATVDEDEAIRPTQVDPSEIIRVIGLSTALGVIGAQAAAYERLGDFKAARELEGLGARFAGALERAVEPRGVTSGAISDLLRNLATEGPSALLDS